MELLVFMKQAAEVGMTAPTIIALGIAWQLHKTNILLDKRVTILETKADN